MSDTPESQCPNKTVMKITRKQRFVYCWAWQKYDVFHHAVTVAAICVALIIGGCVCNSLQNVQGQTTPTAPTP
jgi:hypothetical protein